MNYSVNAPGGNVMPAEIWGGVEFGGMVGGGRQKTFGISSAPAMLTQHKEAIFMFAAA